MVTPGSARVAVVGGGLAGMSAAAALAQEGCRVTLLEKRPVLGGRAGSHLEAAGREWVDNCQHVLMPCCTNLLDFYGRIGVREKIRFYSEIPFIDRRGRVSFLRSSPFLPAPLHLATSFLRLKFISLPDKIRIARGLLALISEGEADEARLTRAGEWFLAHHQSDQSLRDFWHLVLVSALNEDLERTSLHYAAKVFLDAFLSNPRGWWLGIPTQPLSALYGDSLIELLEGSAGAVRLQAEATKILLSDGKARGVQLATDEKIEADIVIIALPWGASARLLRTERRSDIGELPFDGLSPSPITGIHLWFDRPVTELHFAALPGRRVHWFFNKTRTFREGGDQNTYLQLVTSASRDWMERTKTQILGIALEELHEALPRTRDARVVKSYVLKEPAATFSPSPGSDALRPEPVTATENLYLAGDWVATGWPATMEGAVRGGYLAAEAILGRLGRPRKILQPDLPPSGLMRILRKRRAGTTNG